MITVGLSNVARLHGGRTIFDGVTWAIGESARVGLVGQSGVGKSTLLRVIAGIDKPNAGTVTFARGARVAFLDQEFAGQPDRTALAELLAGREDLATLEERIEQAEGRMADPDVLADAGGFDRLLSEHARLLEEFDRAGGPMLRNRAEGLLRDLGFEEEAWDRPMEQLSGGMRKLVGLARCLLQEPDLLLLDEPDNHLDLARKAKLEAVLGDFGGAVVVISHDRYFLDETVTQIAEMESLHGEPARLRVWEGNYSTYATEKELALLRQQQDYVAQQKEIGRLEEAIARFKLWASIVINERHIKQARNKQRQIDRMDKVDRPVLERRKMSLHFRQSQRAGAKAIELRGVDRTFGDNIVLLGASATIMNGERVGIVGGNGAGKSVLMRLMLGQDEPDGGAVWVGPSVQRGRYAQEHETLDMNQTPIEAIRSARNMYEGEAVSQLGRFLIPYDAVRNPIGSLSGGEKSRVQLCRLMLSGANCLLLDEPTNNLDIASCEVLEHALDEFEGTVVVVSHDRYFLDRLVDRILEVREGELRVFDGGYSYYAEQTAAQREPASAGRR
ncbi:MAG: ABC-F family ATP-binding cassette domain-containing protein [Dehalococcoidia bacterium]